MLHDEQPREPGTVSRRKLILTGASLAAAGVAVGAVASIPFTERDSASESAGDGPKEPVMVYLRSGGEFDVFVGQERIRLTDHAFAARLTDAVTAL
ncbi:hypothetical protein [Actinophytocola sp.]|uniref:hypothetical protein n=1 Tax=Actinophytocola sp. TaxID=1872138 RepID=UPI00389B3844